ncbi:hypothetical protein [Sphingosinicella sp. CPCC 101087]|uniref:hypothetical protein n=1 Tax=Sphingosinicella sp. CPCC 101087 TaxID=2497754 RepID=UPI00101BD94B|nr:hypothetical protein [Sphingosinicella sp. CPCC 101087]
MTSLPRSTPFGAAVSALIASAFLLPSAAPAASADPAERALAACRAELTGRFAEGEIRDYRVASITGNSRRTRITFIVNADRRYQVECAAGRDGSAELAGFDPPRSEDRQMAAGQR